MKKLAIFVSGSGTNMENIIRLIQKGEIEAEASVVICDKPGAAAIDKAKKLGVEVALIDRKKFSTKEEFEIEIMKVVNQKNIDYLVLAGFMRLLSVHFVTQYRGRIINIHPSLLPEFPGAHAIRDAFEAKSKMTGVTIHFVDEGVDSGPVILQQKVPVEAKDTLETLEAKIHEVEYKLYPEAIRRVLSGKVKIPGHHREDEFWTND